MNNCFCSLSKIDPSRTTVLRRAFSIEMKKRFKKVSSAIKEFALTAGWDFSLVVNYDFPLIVTKQQEFMSWLRKQEENNIFALSYGDTLETATSAEWADVYITRAYKKGIQRGKSELNKLDVDQLLVDPLDDIKDIDLSFQLPFHAERVALLYSRSFMSLKAITSEMDSQLSTILAEGMLKGLHPKTIANNMVKTIDGLTKKRAIVLARTEVMRAHHKANIAEYRQAGVLGVVVLAEMLTAGDDRVCVICEGLSKDEKGNLKVYTLDEAEDLLPVHPLCRCVVIPHLPDLLKT